MSYNAGMDLGLSEPDVARALLNEKAVHGSLKLVIKFTKKQVTLRLDKHVK
ncbi:MAG: hypothetical protein NTZ74_02720 [Chloroflexi bacterium]|nr:hypothetical protein [Chloroflexota bacterium]